MMQALFTLLCALALTTVSVEAQPNSASATFTPENSDGVSGVVRFVEQPGGPLRVELSLVGPKIVTTGGAMHIHEMWTGDVMDGMGDLCSAANTGGHYNPTNAVGGNVSPYEAGDITNKFSYSLADRRQSGAVFNDTEALLSIGELAGKSIVIHSKEDASRWICAKIVNDNPAMQYVAVATFSGSNTDGVKGTMRFVQTGLEPMKIEYSFIGLNNKATGFHVHQMAESFDEVTMDGKYATCDAGNTGAHHNPTGVPTPRPPGSDYESGDLSGKFGPMTGLETVTMVVDDKSSYLRVGDIVGRSVVIHTAQERWVCAKIVHLDMDKTVSATATFSGARTNGIQGTVTFTQKGLEPAQVTVALNNLKNMTAGYHVHMTPVTPGQTQDKNEGCGAAITGGHWNPTGVLPADNPLRYEAGDLSMKFGSLVNKFSTGTTYTDKADLMRVADIIGRSVVIHATDGSRYACSNIILDDPTERHVAIVDFDYGGASGFIRFSQLGTQPAQISVNMKGLQLKASKVHVHMTGLQNAARTGGDAACSADATGGHWNPTGWVTGQPDNEAGDLTGKMGFVLDTYDKIETIITDAPALLRVRDIIGRSVVVHKIDGSRWFCGTIRRESNNVKYVATAVFSPQNADGVSGIIRFTQNGQSEPAKVEVRLRGLGGKAGGWHVHEKSLVNKQASGQGAACSSTATAGHFNPSGNTAPWTNGYEEGDMSMKFESFAGKDYSYADHTDVDAQLSVFDIIGKSVVIHSAAGDRWVCATIQGDVALSVTATFGGVATDGVRGTIQLTQQPDKKAWITTNLLGLNSRASGWHVHEKALANDAIDGTSCADIGGHFNPTNVGPDDDDEKEVGDLSGKFRNFGDQNEAIMYEEDSPALMSVASIIGKSVLIHKTNGDRWICATFRMDDASQTVTASAMWTNVQTDSIGAPMGGRVTFSQKGQEPANIGWDFSGLASRAAKWHIHKLPVPGDDATACSQEQVAGHWDPSNAAGSTTRFEWGDLSGKFGELEGDTPKGNSVDKADNLNVQALFGKSIVLHSPDGSRWVCANIQVDGVAPYDPSSSSGGGDKGPGGGDGGDGDGNGSASTLASSLVAIVVGVATVLLTAL